MITKDNIMIKLHSSIEYIFAWKDISHVGSIIHLGDNLITFLFHCIGSNCAFTVEIFGKS